MRSWYLGPHFNQTLKNMNGNSDKKKKNKTSNQKKVAEELNHLIDSTTDNVMCLKF